MTSISGMEGITLTISSSTLSEMYSQGGCHLIAVVPSKKIKNRRKNSRYTINKFILFASLASGKIKSAIQKSKVWNDVEEEDKDEIEKYVHYINDIEGDDIEIINREKKKMLNNIVSCYRNHTEGNPIDFSLSPTSREETEKFMLLMDKILGSLVITVPKVSIKRKSEFGDIGQRKKKKKTLVEMALGDDENAIWGFEE